MLKRFLCVICAFTISFAPVCAVNYEPDEKINITVYEKINPDNDILELLSIHFAKRLKNEYWIIEDEGRKIVSIYNKDKFYIIDRCDIKLNLDNTDNVWEDLWIVFFKTIGIKSRENKRCQMSFMPKKYWQNIVEMESIYEECN